ncbi:CbtA family protein [Nitrososphaera sp.]|uniref:CbtA family protein n=1 Tax=Nitrososphaera sp. TaxID=1971748 RepID=UPI00307CF88D
MKTLTFIAITLLSGAVAGTILAIINQGVVEPYIERAIALENERAAEQGEMVNPAELAAYRLWQKGGSIAAGAVLGLSIGALFGLVFAYGRGALPGSSNVKKAIVLAGIMWLVLYFVPALKYPANPPAVGDPATINMRQGLYVAMLLVSGLSALGLAFAYGRVRKTNPAFRVVAPAIYIAVMAAAFFALPANPDEISAPMDLVSSFRLASGATMTMFWLLLGAILGAFWDRTRPHETASIKAA